MSTVKLGFESLFKLQINGLEFQLKHDENTDKLCLQVMSYQDTVPNKEHPGTAVFFFDRGDETHNGVIYLLERLKGLLNRLNESQP
jgi:hypothetical protein